MKKALVLGISGGSGSGKTSIIRALRQRFSIQDLCIISQDDYYRPREEQEQDDQGIKNFDLPQSIDDAAFLHDIRQLMSGEMVERMEYTFNNERKDPKKLTFHPAPVIIVEGLFVFHFKNIRDALDVKVFVHAKDNLKIIRRIKRDQSERNYPIDDVLYRYQYHVMPTFEKYIAPYREDADIVINNNRSFEIGLSFIEAFVRSALASTSE